MNPEHPENGRPAGAGQAETVSLPVSRPPGRRRPWQAVTESLSWGWIAATALAAIATLTLLHASYLAAIAVPVIAVGALVCAWRAEVAVIALFLLTGFAGSIQAFVPLVPTRALADFALASLWVGVLGAYLFSPARHRLWLWPALIAPGLYLGLTALQAIMAESITIGLESFRLVAWPMMAVILVAVAPWGERTLRRIVKGFVLIATLVGLYAVFRYIVGPAPAEELVAKAALRDLPLSELRFFSSFPTAQQLSEWSAIVIPLALAAALVWHGWWRLLSVVAVASLGFAIFATEVRTGVVAVLAGGLVVLVLFYLARAFPRVRFPTALAGLLLVAGVALGAYVIAIEGNPEAEERFRRLLTPSEDPAYSARLERWGAAVEDIEENPFGHGLGRSGAVAIRSEEGPLISPNLDSSYLKIGLEQGIPGLALFAAAMLAILFGLARRAVITRESDKAAIAIGACGALVAMLIFFFSGFHIERVQTMIGWLIIGLAVAHFRPESERAPTGAAVGEPRARGVAVRAAQWERV